jgi:pilus assembly protein CpaF
MSLMQRVERAQQVADNPSAVAVAPPVSPVVLTTSSRAPEREELLRNVRLRLQEEIVGAFNTLVDATPADARAKIEALVDRVMVAQGFVVTRDERLRLILEMVNDVTGLGPLEPLLNDESITEIMVNGPSQI